MKLVVSLSCVGALALVGCVDEETTGGGHLEGIRPAKPSIDSSSTNLNGDSPIIHEDMNQLPPIRNTRHFDANWFGMLGGTATPPEPAEWVCEYCEVTAIKLPRESYGIDEVRIVNDGDLEVCRIYLNEHQVIVNECDP